MNTKLIFDNKNSILIALLIGVVGLLLPTVISDYYLSVAILVFMWGAMASAFNILGGFAGQVCFIPPLFVGLGAYISTWLEIRFSITPWIGMLIAGAICTLLALFIGYLYFRYGLRDVYFALGTMALVMIAQTVFLNLPDFGGAEGMVILIREDNFLMMKFREKLPYYFIAFGLLIATLILNKVVSKTKPGYWFRAIRENQEAAEAVGVNVMNYKQLAIGLTGFFLGVLGTFWAQFVTFIDPYSAFHWEVAGLIIIMVVAGGSGTVFGPFLGALILVPLTEFIRATLGQSISGTHMVVYGVILMIILLYMPDGFMGFISKLRKRTAVGEIDTTIMADRSGESFAALFSQTTPRQTDKLAASAGGAGDQKPILEVKDLTRIFGGLYAVRDLSFTVYPGEIFGIIGPNGAGKTTTFNMISGAIPATSGEIFYKGNRITGLLPHVICKLGIARTFQIAQSFPKLTALETVMVGSFLHHKNETDAKSRGNEILRMVGLTSKADMVCENLTLPDLKRLEVAKALATDPEIVLLDEVIAGLNDVEVQEVVALLKKINRETGITFIMIEHVMQAILSLCDRTLVLNFGQEIMSGTPQEVISDPHVIEAYLGASMENTNA